jgi:hypothetical protein
MRNELDCVPTDACARSGARERRSAHSTLSEHTTGGRGKAHIRPDPWVSRIMTAPSRRRPWRGRVGWATAHARHGRRAGAGLYGVNDRRAAVSREAEHEPDLALIFATARSARNRTNFGSGPGENGEVWRWRPTTGQPLMAAPSRFGSRKYGRSSLPSAMKNVYRSFRSRRASA